MDPVSAVGVAAASLQFFEFSLKIAQTTKQILNSASGLSERQEAFLQIANRLDALATQQTQSLEGLEDGVQVSEASKRLREICTNCRDKARLLSLAVGGLASPGNLPKSAWSSVGGSFGMALKALVNEGRDEMFLRNLENSRQELHTALMVCIWEESKKGAEAIVQMNAKVNAMVSEVRTGRQTDPAAVNEGSHGSKDDQSDFPLPLDTSRLHTVVKEVVERILDRQWKPETSLINVDSGRRGEVQQLVRSLRFEGFQKRYEEIPEAYHSTLQWIWQEKPSPSGDGLLWSSFPEWLRSPNSTFYWVTGKPGSGKSTLMKYIQHHPSLRSHLSAWVPPAGGELPVLIVGFYAWHPGSDTQKSIDGLRRTILARALQQNNNLLARVTPRRWALLNCLPWHADVAVWDSWELEESVSLLLEEVGKQMKVVLLIDGLDEFSTPPKDLVAYIASIGDRGRENVKICAASRPWPAFGDFFKSSPLLAMDQLSAVDLRLFVSENLIACDAFHERKHEGERLKTAVLEKAGGVFLWVSVVTKFLVESLENGDTTAELEEVVRGLPSEMSELYDRIWSRIPEYRRRKSAEIFLLREASLNQKLHFLTLWSVDERPATEVIDPQDVDRIRKTINRRLHSHTHGLLEILPDGMVDYLHRTAHEWTTKHNFITSAYNFWPDDALMTGLCHLSVRSLLSSELVRLRYGRLRWQEYLMCNFMYHAARVAGQTDTDSNDVARCSCTMMEVTIAWQRSYRLRKVNSDWLGTYDGLPALYGVVASIGLTWIFQELKEQQWEDVRHKGSEVLMRAILSPATELLSNWNLSVKTYYSSDVFIPDRKLQVIRQCIGQGFRLPGNVREQSGIWDLRNQSPAGYFNQVADMLDAVDLTVAEGSRGRKALKGVRALFRKDAKSG